MKKQAPSLEEWRTLYDLMSELKAISPWQWLEELDIFALQNPETDEIGFLSVMGSSGEHYSVAVYLGEEGLSKFWDFQENEIDEFSFQRLLEMPQLQASFENREDLFPEDREIIKKLGLTFRGKNAWPLFRSFTPGFAPWFISSSEARFLKYALEQAMDVSIRAKKDPSFLMPGGEDIYFLRQPMKRGGSIQWRDSTWEFTPAPQAFTISLDRLTIEKLNALPSRKAAIEIDIFMSPMAVHEKNTRPYFPYVLLMLETKKGMIIGSELLQPIPDLKTMWENVPSLIAKLLIEQSLKPAKVLTSSDLLYQLLTAVNRDLKLPIEFVEELPFSREARISLLDSMQR